MYSYWMYTLRRGAEFVGRRWPKPPSEGLNNHEYLHSYSSSNKPSYNKMLLLWRLMRKNIVPVNGKSFSMSCV